LTQTKAKDLKNQMCGEFSEIFNLCLEILEKANTTSLLRATLETLLRFLNWIPLGYIFETPLIVNLGERVRSNLLCVELKLITFSFLSQLLFEM
jgi:exportin-1